MSHQSRFYVQSNGIKLHFLQYGASGPQVLLLPGTDPKWLESAGVRSIVDVGRVSEQDIDLWPSPWFGTSGPRTVLSASRHSRK